LSLHGWPRFGPGPTPPRRAPGAVSARTAQRQTMGERTSALSGGTNALLKLGAGSVTCAGDVLELFDLAPAAREPVPVGPVAQALYARLQEGALTADKLVRASGVDPAQASAALIELELASRVALEDGVYRASV